MINPFKQSFYDLMEDWSGELGQDKVILNTITEWLAEDVWWVHNHMSKVDKAVLLEIANKIQGDSVC